MSASAGPVPPLLDRPVLDDLVEHLGGEAVRSVANLFLGEARNYVAAIVPAAAAGTDATLRERARRAAHSLKSGAGQIGAAALAAAAAAVEHAAAENSPALAGAIAALEAQAAETATALAQFLATLAEDTDSE